MHILLAAALAGLLATPHCAAMCGGFATACGRHSNGLVAWHAGRLVTYVVMGVIAGSIGGVLPGPPWVPAAFSALLLTWFAAGVAGFTSGTALKLPGLVPAATRFIGRPGVWPRFAFGALNGLLPCGMVYAALSLAVAAQHPLTGAGAMLAFGAGTVPGLAALSVGLRRFAARGVWARRALAALILCVGL